MKVNNSLAQHLEGNRTIMPAFHKTVKILCNEQDDEKIFNHIVNLDYLDKISMKMPKMTVIKKNEILEIIKELKAFYKKL